ncbi:glycosyl hydrolase family 18 protein [uncultured Oscillibacter sp.]|uniref:glycosyl hydrolase family 18 protein n=1 Tax=uncultured Oscillibacter sp. TaxID=876091 RepID=UPI00262B7E76|nr:glycosyl hydrolase family 18 protein [uncultured Oscillibacter sp.]
MRKTRRFILLALLFALLLPLTDTGRASAAGGSGTGEVVGYYASWAAAQGHTPDKLPAERFTQINYAFAKIEDGRAALGNPARDAENLRELAGLRRRNPDLKIVLSLGGWDDSTGFSGAAASLENRKAFSQSCVDLLLAHDLDGVDLDWEYPVSGGAPGTAHLPQDKQNFTLLLRELRQALDRQGRRDGKSYVLSIAGAVNGGYLNCIEPREVAEAVDHIFLMAYDLQGPWDAYAGFNAPLHAPTDGPPRYHSSVDSGVSAWLAQGVPAEKLVLGMPLYGYIYQGVSSRNGGLYQPFESAKSVPWDRVKDEYLSRSAYRRFRHQEAEVPYLYGNRAFLSYDDPASIAAKADLARRRGLGGVGFWELSQDRDGELVQSAWSAWHGGRFQDVPQDAWYAGAVERVCAAGLMKGTGPGTFSPGGTVTRGQTAAILHRLAGEPVVRGSSFSDVSTSAYYGGAVAWAARRGIVEGFPDGTFRPDLPVSRQQLAAILWRYAKLEQADSGARAALQGFPDAGEVGGYAREPMRWALAEGILQGTKDGTLQPQGRAARGQAAVLLERFQSLLEAE